MLRSELVAFVCASKSFEPEKFRVEPASIPNKEKRVSLRLDQIVYEKAQAKSHSFGGVSGLVRVILKKYCT